jgi:hypothetical protein
VIAEMKDLKALRFDYGRSGGVFLFGLIGKMLAAVELDHELGCVTDEIGDEVLDRDLTAEARAVQAMAAEL